MGKKLDRKAYLALIKPRYQHASKKVKAQVLDEFCLNCDYNRKYAITLLSQKGKSIRCTKRRKRKNRSEHIASTNKTNCNTYFFIR